MTAYHTIKTFARRIVIPCLLASSAGCSDRAAGEYPDKPYGSVSVAYLKSLARSSSTVIADDIAITGYVAVNDLYGEYTKTIIVCDESGGMEIAVDSRTTATVFPVSARVTVHCSSLALGDYGGRIILGARPSGSYTVDRIAASDFGRYFLIDKSNPVAVAPVSISIDELTPEKIGRLVELRDVTFAEQAGSAWCDTDPETGEYLTTSRKAYDREGRYATVRTIADCLYRAEPVPSGYGTIHAVVEYFNGEYSLRIANHGIDFRSDEIRE